MLVRLPTRFDEFAIHINRKIKYVHRPRNSDHYRSNMKDLIKTILESGHSNDNLNTVMKNYFEGLTLELVLGQKTDSEIKDHGQRRYSALMKQFANTLFMFRVQ